MPMYVVEGAVTLTIMRPSINIGIEIDFSVDGIYGARRPYSYMTEDTFDTKVAQVEAWDIEGENAQAVERFVRERITNPANWEASVYVEQEYVDRRALVVEVKVDWLEVTEVE